MNFPSTEFDDAVTAACQGTGSEADVAALHATLRAHEAARDDYLWQVELHSYLASLALRRTTGPALSVTGKPDCCRLSVSPSSSGRLRQRPY